MTKDARKNWAKHMIFPKLDAITKELEELQKFSDGAGGLPVRIQKKIATCVQRNSALVADIRSWAATGEEKIIQKIKEK